MLDERAFRRAEEPRFERLHPDVVKRLRAMSGMERLRLAHEAWELARDRLTAFFHAAHPDWAPDRIQREVAARLGRDADRADAD